MDTRVLQLMSFPIFRYNSLLINYSIQKKSSILSDFPFFILLYQLIVVPPINDRIHFFCIDCIVAEKVNTNYYDSLFLY